MTKKEMIKLIEKMYRRIMDNECLKETFTDAELNYIRICIGNQRVIDRTYELEKELEITGE